MQPFLEISEVSKQYATHLALDKVSFSVPEGAIFGLLGPNGAGKTTLIRIINQITAADTGEVKLKGERLSPNHISMIGYLPEERGLYKKMKVLDQVIYFARLKDVSASDARKKANEWMERFSISDWRNKKVEELSKGMQQKIQFITTVIHKPKLIILDEPFSGFDPVNTELIMQEIKRLRDEGATVIFSTHRMESVEEICDFIGMINRSKKVLEGSVSDVKESYRENKIAVEYSGESVGKMPTALESKKLPNGNTQNIYELNPGEPMMHIVSEIDKQVHIRSFREVVPSMHDIFIKLVQEKSI
jgi:ABC-2 type transport system ATP-binding protein